MREIPKGLGNLLAKIVLSGNLLCNLYRLFLDLEIRNPVAWGIPAT